MYPDIRTYIRNNKTNKACPKSGQASLIKRVSSKLCAMNCCKYTDLYAYLQEYFYFFLASLSISQGIESYPAKPLR